MKRFELYILFILITFSACSQQKQTKASQGLLAGHYDLSQPQVFNMPKELDEISGITFYNGNPDTIYAEQDEEGKVFKFHLGNEAISKTKFGNKGDYEDIQICNNYVVMLRSDGTLYTFLLSETNAKETSSTKEFKHILPGGEYEGLYADNKNSKVYALCKSCNEKQDKTSSLYILSINRTGDLKLEQNTTINVKSIAEKMLRKKLIFHPSAIVQNQTMKDWLILSSVNKIVVLTSADFTVKEVFDLDPSVFNQPEGIAFDNANNLYISNEKGSTQAATVLKFLYKK